jgi:CheY-like chemotaxis protein
MARILIVEDEAIIAMDMAQQLQRMGHTVVAIVHDGEAAIVQATQATPDVILMDVRLKGALDGIQTAAQIVAQRDVPIIFMTAFTDPATLQRMRQTGHCGLLFKPVAISAVRDTLQQALRDSPSPGPASG